MIKTETVELMGKQFLHTFSDSNFYIERDGVTYEDAYDPVGLCRSYSETLEKIIIPIEDDTEATIEDYKEALIDMGVNINEEK